MRCSQNRRGFTIIELLIVVAIIGLLAGIAYPSYQRYLTRSRQGVALAALEAVRLAMENYRSKNGTYLAAGEDVDLLPGYETVMWRSTETRARYVLTINSASATSFLVKATCHPADGCNIDSDDTADIWSVDHLGQIVCLKNDMKE